MIPKLGVSVIQVAVILMVAACGALAQDLPVPNQGRLRLRLPAPWKEVQRLTPKDLPPTIAFERDGSPRGSLQVTVLWSPKGEPAFTSLENIRAFCLAGQGAFKGQTVEQAFPLRAIEGTQGKGFHYDATDKSYTAAPGQPTPGEFPVLTHGELGLGRLMLSFTIMSDAKGDLAVDEALTSLRKATLQLDPPAGSARTVKGAGIELQMALDGFHLREGEKHFKGAYYQVAFFTSAATGLNLSILVDDLRGMTLADLEKAGIGQSQGMGKLLPGGKVSSEPVEAPKGVLVSYPAGISFAEYRDYFQGQWYFETIHQGKWLELHFSKIFKQGEDTRATHAEVLRLVRSIQVADPGR